MRACGKLPRVVTSFNQKRIFCSEPPEFGAPLGRDAAAWLQRGDAVLKRLCNAATAVGADGTWQPVEIKHVCEIGGWMGRKEH